MGCSRPGPERSRGPWSSWPWARPSSAPASLRDRWDCRRTRPTHRGSTAARQSLTWTLIKHPPACMCQNVTQVLRKGKRTCPRWAVISSRYLSGLPAEDSLFCSAVDQSQTRLIWNLSANRARDGTGREAQTSADKRKGTQKANSKRTRAWRKQHRVVGNFRWRETGLCAHSPPGRKATPFTCPAAVTVCRATWVPWQVVGHDKPVLPRSQKLCFALQTIQHTGGFESDFSSF